MAALAARLRAARDGGEPFAVVHFDGHGVLGGEGSLVFERPGGGADYVTADRLAGALVAAEVPVAVLNACQSGAIGKRLEAAVATGLLAGGVDAVVAMSYRVYAVAAAEFMAAFYDRLLAGDGIGEAVRAGRSRMARRPGRPSPKGELPLEDWAVPVYYRRREVRFPGLRAEPPASPDDGPLAAPDDDPLASEGEFVGRDDEFCALEAAARTDRVLVLHGTGGTGKTELAKAFGRWWRDTGGVDRPDDVYWHFFEPGAPSAGLDAAILAVGLRLCGPAFALRDPAARREEILQQLRTRRLLLVWDNFESAVSMPGGVAPSSAGTVQAELAEFLGAAARGRGTILITSRTPEGWLGDVRRLAVGGLPPHEAIEYADQVLAPVPAAAARRADRSFAELLEWLDGHPLSMRLILPHLATTEPSELLAGLRGTRPLPVLEEKAVAEPEADGDARTRSLSASVGYSVAHLPPAGRRLLVALSLLRGVADIEILGALSASEHAPARLRGVGSAEWDSVLAEAARLGLLTARADGGYGIHPALPAYLAAQWRAEEPALYTGARAAADRALLEACAAAGGRWGKAMESEASAEAYAFIDRNRAAMARMLGYALESRRWTEAQPIYITLGHYLNRAGLGEEFRSWSQRARRAVEGPGGVPTTGVPSTGDPLAWRDILPAVTLWNLVVMSQADVLRRAGDLDGAQACYRQILRWAENAPGFPASGTAMIHDKLAFVAEERGQLDEATEIYRKALALHEESGDRDGAAQSLRHLGSVAVDRGRWDEAERHYRDALDIFRETAEDLYSVQLTYDGLGKLAERRGRLAEAEEWYAESLALAEQRHDWDGTARCLYNLGMLSRQRGQLAEAERWYRRCLTLAERARDRPGLASVYSELGMVALLRGQDEAEEWFRRSRAIHEELGDRSHLAVVCRQLGLVAMARRQMDEAARLLSDSLAIEEDIGQRDGMLECYQLLGGLEHGRGRLDEAERWLRDALALAGEMGHGYRAAACHVQLGMLARARGDSAEALEQTVRALALAERFPQLRDRAPLGQVLSYAAKRLGIGAVEECWQRVTGDRLPDDVRRLALTEQPEQDPGPPAQDPGSAEQHSDSQEERG
jgi:tetratricopeptide (TPR) repeat protein